jgi:VanZ family protein
MMAAIFSASSTPAAHLPNFGLLDTLVKKGGHMAGYFLLALAYLRGLNTSSKKAAFIALGLVMFYAASDEFHQSFVPGRHPSPLDAAIDMAGAVLALWIAHIHAPLKRFIRAGLQY